MTTTAPALTSPTVRHTAHVHVSVADPHGWDIQVELDGRIVTTEHCTDWHRAERHRARLEAQFGAPPVEQTA